MEVSEASELEPLMDGTGDQNMAASAAVEPSRPSAAVVRPSPSTGAKPRSKKLRKDPNAPKRPLR